jgi:hypothetical protein
MPGMRIVARNLTSTPITVDRKGHQLGAGEYGVVDTDDHVTERTLAAGNLAEFARPAGGADVDPAAEAAFAELDAADADDGEGQLEQAAAAHTADGAAPAAKKTTAPRKATG